MIDYEDLKSEWLPVPRNSSIEFTIKKDATKVIKESKKTGNPYPSYEFGVEHKGEKLKWSTLMSQYRQMTIDAGKPATLVDTKWCWSHASVNGEDKYSIEFLGKKESSSELVSSGEVKKEGVGASAPASSSSEVRDGNFKRVEEIGVK